MLTLSPHTPNLRIKYLLCAGGERQILLRLPEDSWVCTEGREIQGLSESLLSNSAEVVLLLSG